MIFITNLLLGHWAINSVLFFTYKATKFIEYVDSFYMGASAVMFCSYTLQVDTLSKMIGLIDHFEDLIAASECIQTQPLRFICRA